MPLETSTYISGLVETNPVGGSDEARTADDHLRLIKAAIKRTFPNVTGEVVATHTDLNYLADMTGSAQSQLDALKDGKLDISATAVYAQSAGYAAGAASAAFATSANRAASAVRANSAVYARTAGYAITAAAAANAVNADNATSAVFADSARAATSAVRATSAIRANSAVYATSAGDYNGAVSAGQIPDASVGGQGVVELGTTAEYATGTDAARAASLAVLGRPRSKAASGYITLPGGVIMEWGIASFSTGTTTMTAVAETFNATFSSVYQIAGTLEGTDAIGLEYQCEAQVADITTSGFNVRFKKAQSSGAFEFRWIAIGSA